MAHNNIGSKNNNNNYKMFGMTLLITSLLALLLPKFLFLNLLQLLLKRKTWEINFPWISLLSFPSLLPFLFFTHNMSTYYDWLIDVVDSNMVISGGTMMSWKILKKWHGQVFYLHLLLVVVWRHCVLAGIFIYYFIMI